MNFLKSHLALYFLFGILYFIAIIMDWLYLSYVTKPLFIGAIFFYYVEESKTPVTYYNCAIIGLLFISGMINLIEGYSYFIYVLFLNFLAYCLLLYHLIKELLRKKHTAIQKENLLFIILTLVFLICALYISSFIVFDKSFELYKVIIVYGLVVASVVFCATLLYLSASTQKNTYLMLYALDIIICELFYGIYHYYYRLLFIRLASVFCYILSFYFLAKYFVKENNAQSEE
nr:hypothetical protein [uncultured Flavobacterium sp.]